MRSIIMLCALFVAQAALCSAYASDVGNDLFDFPGFNRIREHDAPKELIVVIKKKLDKKSFSVLLNGKKVTSRVDPRPGKKVIALPFIDGLNEVIFTAKEDTQSEIPVKHVQLQIMYRPNGDAAVMQSGGATIDDTPRARALMDEMMKAAHSNNIKRVQEIQLEIKALRKGNE